MYLAKKYLNGLLFTLINLTALTISPVAWSSEKICNIASKSQKEKYLNQLDRLIKKEADLNDVDCDGFNLIEAVIENDINAVRQLLVKGTNPDSISKSGSTALNIAISEKHYEIVKLLIKAGANPTLQNRRGYHPLSIAVSNNNLEIIELLIDRGVPVDLETAQFNRTSLMLSRNVETSRLLLDKGADINRQSQYGYTALFEAVQFKNLPLVKLLLDRGANIIFLEQDDKSPFLKAIETKQFEVVKLFIESAVERQQQLAYASALRLAISNKQPKIVQLLMPYVNESEKATAYDRALLSGNNEIINIFKGENIEIADKKELFDKAVQNRNIQLIKQLLVSQEVKDYLESDRGSLNLLEPINNDHELYHVDKVEIAKILIDNGANVNVAKVDKNSSLITTPLLSAIKARFKSVELVQLLMERGVDINIKNYNDRTPLSAAINKVNLVNFEGVEPPEEIEKNLSWEEYVKYRNEYYAQQYKEELKRLADESLIIVELLLQAGANPEVKIRNYSLEEIIALHKQDKNEIMANYGKKLASLLQKYSN